MARAGNSLIERLPTSARGALLALCERVPLTPGSVLQDPGERILHVHFPVVGSISLVTDVDHHCGLEVGMVGPEGMLGMHLGLGMSTSPVRAVVQGEGSAWRVGAADFQRERLRSPALARVIEAYLGVVIEQFGRAVACRRFHEISPRLARWLLMSQDRLHSASFHVTHEVLAQRLGVRRVGITTAAGAFQRNGLIGYHRGQVTVLDRSGLEAVACSCFAADCRAYQAVLG